MLILACASDWLFVIDSCSCLQACNVSHKVVSDSVVAVGRCRVACGACASSNGLSVTPPACCSDVQYADIPNGQSFHGVPRYYRNSLVATRRAVVEGWAPANVQFGIHFGDILDGYQPKVGFLLNVCSLLLYTNTPNCTMEGKARACVQQLAACDSIVHCSSSTASHGP